MKDILLKNMLPRMVLQYTQKWKVPRMQNKHRHNDIRDILHMGTIISYYVYSPLGGVLQDL